MSAMKGKQIQDLPTIEEVEKKPPIHLKPKILLMDVKDDSAAILEAAGYNVSVGSFGTPYAVAKSDDLTPVIPNHELPTNVSEQEIVIIDLMPADVLPQAIGQKVVSRGAKDWWTKASLGYVDPRPRTMVSLSADLDRILAHGGVLVVFADSRIRQAYCIAHYEIGIGLTVDKDLVYDNWSFLDGLSKDTLTVIDDGGEEITVSETTKDLSTILRTNLTGATFNCSFASRLTREPWIRVAENKFGGCVSWLLVPKKTENGMLLVLPQLENKSEFLLKLLQEWLPLQVPSLFPDFVGAKWVEQEPYEISRIVELKQLVRQINKEAVEKVESLKAQIEGERKSNGYLYDLIRETDTKLVDAVKKTLDMLGFKKIKDVDSEKSSNSDAFKDEDLQVDDYSPLLLVEVKGVGGKPADAEALQVAKHIAPRMKELRRHDIQGLSIINHERNIPPLERENRKPFRDTILAASVKQDVGLMTSWDLFRLARGFQRNGWTQAHIKDVFYRTGRIEPIPTHYVYLGEMQNYWEKPQVLSIKIENGVLKKGDRIAFMLPVDFVEQVAESMQIDNADIAEVTKGKEVAVQTVLTKDQARKGTKVYLVKQ